MSSLRDKLARLRSALAPSVSAQEAPAEDVCESRVVRDDDDDEAPPFARSARWPTRRIHAVPDAEVAPAFDPDTGEFVRATMNVWGPPPSAHFHRQPDPQDTLPGQRADTVHGPLRTCRALFAADHRHGGVCPSLALGASADDVALLALEPALAALDLSRALYIDTETTGLLGGTGTIPFLVGMAWFEDDTLVVEQMFLERLGEETPMLQRLRERIAAASVLVSFNGKSFDWPLLRTRFVLARMTPPSIPPHLDLLHLARRVYKRRLGSVRLTALENALLGFERIDDVDGAAIPELYLGYLRGRVEKRALVPVIDHNRLDLVALPALLGEISRRFRAGQVDARDALGFAQVSARAHGLGFAEAYAQALSLVDCSAERDVRGEVAPAAHLLAGELQRKQGDFASAVRSFSAAIACSIPGGDDAARAHLALAKLYEHKLRHLEHALRHAVEAAEARAEHSLEAEKRLARLRDKLRRGEAQR